MTIQPGNLRPLKAGEILDRAFRLYRANFWHFTAVAGIVLGPLLLLQLSLQFLLHNTGPVGFIQLMLTYLLDGALLWVASHAYLGTHVTMDDSYRTAGRYFPRFVGVSLLHGLVYVPMIFISIFIMTAFSFLNNSVAVVLVVLVVAPYIFFFSVRWWFSYPVIILENLTVGDALKRSWALTSQEFWHTGVVWIASSLLVYLISFLPSVLIGFATQLFAVDASETSVALAAVIFQLGSVITLPISMSILVIAYYDMRIRIEGYDLELALQSTPAMLNNIQEA